MPTINEIKGYVLTLTDDDKQALLALLSSPTLKIDLMSTIKEAKFSSGLHCVHCGCTENIVRNGTYKGKQRYLCKNCKSTFMDTTNSIFHASKKSLETWMAYINCLIERHPIRKAANICGISVPTAFYWRHKILGILFKMRNSCSLKLQGIIESDETYFRVSYKGSRHLPEGRKPYKRGTKHDIRGLSKSQVCVPCAIDRSGTTLTKANNLGKISCAQLERFFTGRVKDNSIFCTDSEKCYRKFAKQHNYRLFQIESGKHKKGIYHISHVNALHNNIKRFMDKFRGVSTKYLDNYLTWQISSNMNGKEIVKSIGYVNARLRNMDISNRLAVPIA